MPLGIDDLTTVGGSEVSADRRDLAVIIDQDTTTRDVLSYHRLDVTVFNE
jgi:hypothetical protein